MARPQLLVLLAILLLTLFTDLIQAGYVIDTVSCGPAQSVRNKNLRKQLASAFSMIKKVNNKLPVNFQNFDNNADQNLKDLFDLLFNHNVGDYAAVKRLFHVASSGYVQDESNNKKDPSNIIIYCDMKRIEKKQKDGQDEWYDNDLNRWLPINQKREECKTAERIPPGTPLEGWTYVDQKSPINGGQSYPDIIQLCEWYAKEELGNFFPSKLVLWMLKVPGFDKIPGLRGKTQIDGFDLADSMLLHEITHTSRGGNLEPGGGRDEEYGWQDCHQGKHVDNSDNMMYFALGNRLLENRFKVQADGSICRFRRSNGRRDDDDGDDGDLTCPPNNPGQRFVA